jgi:oligosaccharide repeat unit polymerase
MIESAFIGITLLVMALTVRMVVNRPSHVLRPSLIILAGYLGIYSIPACFQLMGFWAGDPLTEEFLIVLASFTVLGQLVIANSFSAIPEKLLTRIKLSSKNALKKREKKVIEYILFLIILLILSIYFSIVPFNTIGLYAILFDPDNASAAREASLKLLDSQALKYAMAFLLAAFAPFLFVFSGINFFEAIGKRLFTDAFRAFMLCLFAVLVLLLAGERSRTFFATLALILAFMLRNWNMRFSARVLLLLPIAIVPPVLLTILREGKGISDEFWSYFIEFFLWRIGSGPLQVALWHVDYASTFGQVGIAGIPKLAGILGIRPLDLPNTIGLRYAFAPGETISAGTGFLFSYYAMFGYLTLIPSVAALLLVDLILFFSLRINIKLLVPLVACLAQPSIGFINADFSTVWLSHGIVALLLLGYFLGKSIESTKRPSALTEQHFLRPNHVIRRDETNRAS